MEKGREREGKGEGGGTIERKNSYCVLSLNQICPFEVNDFHAFQTLELEMQLIINCHFN